MEAVLIGLLAGTCTGLGLGGGSVLILFLNMFLNFDQHIAQATNIICFVPSSIISILVNIKNKNINFKLAYPIILVGLIGSLIGSVISSNLDVYHLRKMFGFFLIFISLTQFYSIIKPYIKKEKNT